MHPQLWVGASSQLVWLRVVACLVSPSRLLRRKDALPGRVRYTCTLYVFRLVIPMLSLALTITCNRKVSHSAKSSGFPQQLLELGSPDPVPSATKIAFIIRLELCALIAERFTSPSRKTTHRSSPGSTKEDSTKEDYRQRRLEIHSLDLWTPVSRV